MGKRTFFKTINKNSTVWCITVLLIAAAFLFGGFRSLGKLRNDAEAVFLKGDSVTSFDMRSDMERYCELSANLLTISGRYLDKNTAVCTEVDKYRLALNDAGGVESIIEAYDGLTKACAALTERLKAESLSETDSRFLVQNESDMKSVLLIIARQGSAYGTLANNFNQALSKFPASFIKTLGLAKQLPGFE